MIFLGVFGKFGAVFITIPDPVIGGMFLVMFGMIAAVGISNLQVNTSGWLFIFSFPENYDTLSWSSYMGKADLPQVFHSNLGKIFLMSFKVGHGSFLLQ